MGLLDKFLETLMENGLKWLIKPAQIEQNGIAEAHVQRRKMLMEAKTENDIEKYKQGLIDIDDNGYIISKANFAEIMLLDEDIRIINKKSNLINTLNKARILLENKSDLAEENTEKIELNWFNRWREEAENSSTEEIQYLWAQVLKQEITIPNSVSLRTLDFIRNLSKKEALLIEKIISYSFANLVVFDITQNSKNMSIIDIPNVPDENNSFITQMGISQNQLYELKELGIIGGVGFSGVIWDIPTQSDEIFFYNMILNNNIHIKITKNNKNFNPQFNAYNLTNRGIELKNILEINENMEYFNIIFSKLKTMGYDIVLSKEEN